MEAKGQKSATDRPANKETLQGHGTTKEKAHMHTVNVFGLPNGRSNL